MTTLKKPNTKIHWTALALTRYWEQFDEAARARDLYPFVQDIHENPDSLISSLSNLREGDVIGFATMQSPTNNGRTTKAFAYYPTNITIDRLRDVGEPSKLPNGEYVPEDLDTSIPDARVTAEEEDDVSLPSGDATGLEYVNMGGSSSRSKLPSRDYDTSNLKEVDGVVDVQTDEDVDDIETEDEDKYECPFCGDTFGNPHRFGGHKSACKPDPDEITHEFDPSWDDVDDALDFVFTTAFDSDDTSDDEEPVEIRPEPEFEEMADSMSSDDIDEASDEDVDTALNGFDPMKAISTDQVGYNPRAASRKLSRRAERAFDAGLYDIATTYSQFAELAKDGELEEQMLEILLGQPVLEQERDAQVVAD